MTDNQLYARMWFVLGAVFISMIGSCTYSTHDKRDKWEKAVSNGADPMVASCALFQQSEAEQVACTMLAQNRK